MPQDRAGWELDEGDEISQGLISLKKIGGGERYEVYLAWSEPLFSLVVAKVLRPSHVDDPSSLRSLRREGEILRSLDHPILLRCFGAVWEGPRPHLVLEHLEGPPLSRLIRRHGPLLPEQVLPLALHVCSALHYLSAESIVHLDVKPSNIIMGSPPRLVDLSIARSLSSVGKIATPVGTRSYMAPEQCLPAPEKIGPATDMWGLGVTLYEAILGHRPFPKPDDLYGIEYPQLVQEPAPFPPGYSSQVVDPVMACMSKEPAERPTAAELALSLEDLVAQVPRKPVLGRIRPKIRRKR